MTQAKNHAAQPPEPDLTGQRLGDFQILRRLGRGGMAVVYLAEQLSLKRPVALKVLRSALAGDSNYVQRFHHEAQAAAKLAHANIVQIYDVGCVDNHHYIAQEYVSGPNLKQYLARHGGLSPGQVVAIMAQVAAALQVAAEQGIVHRDIKPENTMLTSKGEVKVADFGLARIMGDGRQVELTQAGVTLGTPLYMSPEQVEGKKLDPRSDLYSLGVMSYQMLAGRPPFEADSPLSLAVQHLQKEPKSLDQIRRDLPPALCRVVHRLLAKNRSDRYQSPAELLQEPRRLAGEAEGEQGDPTFGDLASAGAFGFGTSRFTDQLADVMQTQTMMLRRRRRFWWLVPAALLAFLVGLGGSYLLRRPRLLETQAVSFRSVPKQDSAREQFYHALMQNTEAAYRAVIHYFPPTFDEPKNEYYANLAWQKLGELYLEQNQLQRALRAYGELARLGNRSPEFAVIGLFGQANVYGKQGKRASVESMLAQAAQFWERFERPQQTNLRQLLDESLQGRFDSVLRLRTRPEERPMPTS